MNILFIEDEEALLAAGMEQIEFLGHTVYPASNLSQAKAILDDTSISVQFIIADQLLPDGCGIEFVKETLITHPRCKPAIVSAYLTEKNIKELKELEITYYLKPLLYSTVIADLRSKYMAGKQGSAKSASNDSYIEYQKKRQANEKKRIDALKNGIDRAYGRFVRSRVLCSIAIGTLFGLIATQTLGMVYPDDIFVLAGALLISLTTAYQAIRIFLPTAKQRTASRELIHSAVNEPSRIKSFQKNRVRIVGPSGETIQLKGIEQKIWQSKVVPFFLESKFDEESNYNPSGRGANSQKIEELQRRQQEVSQQGKALELERDRLRKTRENMRVSQSGGRSNTDTTEKEKTLREREAELEERLKQLERDSRDLEERASYVTDVENSLMSRLNNLSEREAYVEQREIDRGILSDR